MKLQTGIII